MNLLKKSFNNIYQSQIQFSINFLKMSILLNAPKHGRIRSTISNLIYTNPSN